METEQVEVDNKNLSLSIESEVIEGVQESLKKKNVEERVNGQVKWFNSKKGFGFITYKEASGKFIDIFVHHTCIQYSNAESFRNLVTGEYVEFVVSPCPGKQGQFQAEKVTGINYGPLMSEIRNQNRLSMSENKKKTINRKVVEEDEEGWKKVTK